MAAAVAQHVLLRPVAGRSNFRHRDALPAAPLAVHSLQLGLASSREAKSAGRQRAPLRCQALSSAGSAGAAPQQQQHANARRVVLAVDPTEDSVAAFNWVLNNLLKPQDELHLLHVVPDIFFGPSSGSIYYCSSPDPETERLLWQQAKQFFVDNFLEHAKGCGLEDSVYLHLVKERRHKHIGKAVCKKAEELGADPLVVASHDKGPLEELLLGSVSKFCATHSKRPVLLLHPNHSSL